METQPGGQPTLIICFLFHLHDYHGWYIRYLMPISSFTGQKNLRNIISTFLINLVFQTMLMDRKSSNSSLRTSTNFYEQIMVALKNQMQHGLNRKRHLVKGVSPTSGSFLSQVFCFKYCLVPLNTPSAVLIDVFAKRSRKHNIRKMYHFFFSFAHKVA